jgi:hypothetical protein
VRAWLKANNIIPLGAGCYNLGVPYAFNEIGLLLIKKIKWMFHCISFKSSNFPSKSAQFWMERWEPNDGADEGG